MIIALDQAPKTRGPPTTFEIKIQWKLLNVITLGLRDNDVTFSE
jgi:hypothetical protein